MFSPKARFYARVFSNYVPSGLEENILKDLNTLGEHISHDKEYLDFFASPKATSKEKLEAFTNSPVLKSLMFILLKNKDMHLLPKIAQEFKALQDKKSGIQEATFISTHKLDKAYQKKIKDLLGKKFDLKFDIDSTLLGGMRFFWGSYMLPLSSKDFLLQIEKNFSEILAS